MQTHYDDFFEEVFVELETKVHHVTNKNKCSSRNKNSHLGIMLLKTSCGYFVRNLPTLQHNVWNIQCSDPSVLWLRTSTYKVYVLGLCILWTSAEWSLCVTGVCVAAVVVTNYPSKTWAITRDHYMTKTQLMIWNVVRYKGYAPKKVNFLQNNKSWNHEQYTPYLVHTFCHLNLTVIRVSLTMCCRCNLQQTWLILTY